jgi:2-amino-4-hydroxy-6-hydroxymethyldihydropteridine diphosphokinase
LKHRYLIALGSNKRHHRYGRPAEVVHAALGALDKHHCTLKAASPIITSAPIGPSQRQYANAVALVKTRLDPDEMLAYLQATEAKFGRRSGGQRWSARVLDLDLLLWSGGSWSSPDLTIPHPAFRYRTFVLGPAKAIAPHWRDPITRCTIGQLYARLTKPRPLPRAPLVVGALSSVGRATDF